MSRTLDRFNQTQGSRLPRKAPLWRRRMRRASVGVTVAAIAAFGSLALTSRQETSAASPVTAASVPLGFRFDNPPAPAGAGDMSGMDMSGSSPAPTDPAETPGMSGDMPGMNMDPGAAYSDVPEPSPTPTASPDAPGGMDMPGMDMPGSRAHSDATGSAAHRPLAPVLGTFGGGTAAVMLTAGFMRRKDRAASIAKNAARIAGRGRK
jgi:hypothetical protein